jgi:hypothetical protein
VLVDAEIEAWTNAGMVSADNRAVFINFAFPAGWIEIKTIVIGKSNRDKNLFFKI